MKWRKLLKFLFPIPTAAIMSFMLVGTYIGYASSENENLIGCIVGLLFFYIFLMIPLDVAIWLIKKLIAHIKRNSLSAHEQNVYNYNSKLQDKESTFYPKRNESQNRYDVEVAIKKVQDLQREYDLYESRKKRTGEINFLREKYYHNLHILELNKDKLQNVSDTIAKLYKHSGVDIIISKPDIRVNDVVYKVLPHNIASVYSIMRLKDDLSLHLGVSIEMEKQFSNGAIGIIIPIEYFEQ